MVSLQGVLKGKNSKISVNNSLVNFFEMTLQLSRRAEVAENPFRTPWATGDTDVPSVPDQKVRKINPFRLWRDLHEIFFNLLRICISRQSKQVG